MPIPVKALVVVPTYWTFEQEDLSREKVSYDHPTPLNTQGTLAHLLRSLTAIEAPPFAVMVITATTDPGLEEAAERQVETIIAPFRKSLPIAQFAGTDLRLLRDRLASQGMAEGMLSLQGYGNVRNLQLLVACMLGYPW